jgi:hypothetical protein
MASRPEEPSNKRLSFQEAAELVRERIGGSVGRSHAELRKALASGEVRHEPAHPLISIDGKVGNMLVYDDGAIEMNLRPGPMNWVKRGAAREGWPSRTSQADLVDWLDRHHPQAKPTESWRHETPAEATKPPAPSVPAARKDCSAITYRRHFEDVMKTTGMTPRIKDDTAWAKNEGFNVKGVLKRRGDFKKSLSTKKQKDCFKPGPRRQKAD